MRDGLYKIMFQTQYGRGSGVIHAHGGRLWGGDATMFWVGTYEQGEGEVTATVNVDRHTKRPMSRSVFGVDRVSITIAAVPSDATNDNYRFTGAPVELPRVALTGILQRIAD